MRIVVQRVKQASVSVGGVKISNISRGVLILLGITHGDTLKQAEILANKALKIRLWPQQAAGEQEQTKTKTWHRSMKDLNYEAIVVSQFTLYGIMKGNKPDFHCAMPGEVAKTIYQHFIATMRKNHSPQKIQTGAFGEKMQVGLINDGPVTMTIQLPPEQDKGADKKKKGKKSQLQEKEEENKLEAQNKNSED